MTCRHLRALSLGVASATLIVLFGPSPADGRAPRTADDAATLTIDEQNYAVTPGESFTASVTVTGSTIDARAQLVVSVHEAVDEAADLVRTDVPVIDTVTLAAASVLTVADGVATGDVSVPVEVGGDATGSLDVVAAGIHPLTIELAGSGADVSASTLFEVLDPAAPLSPLSIAVVARADDVATRDAIVAAAGTVEEPLSVALLPAVAAAQPLPADALRSDELLALPAADLDPSALVAVDESGIFTRALREGEDLLSTASPLAVVSRAVWLADRPISAPAVEMLRDLGTRMLLVTDDVAAGLGVDPSANVFSVDLGAGASLPVMTVDGRGAALGAGPADDGATPDQRAARLLAELRLARNDGDGAALVLGAPDLAVPDAKVLARLAAFVDTLPDTNIVSLSRLPGLVDRELADDERAVALPATAGADLRTRQSSVDAVRGEAGHAASMLIDSSLPDEWGRRLDALLASDVDDPTAAQRLAEIQAELDGVLGSIVAPEPFTFTLQGSSNTLRLPIRNTGEQPLRVDVLVRSPKLTVDEPRQEVTIPALSSLEVQIPVQARTQGTFTTEVDVLAPDGHRLEPPVVLKGRVSHLSGLSQVVTVGAVLVLASWWYTHLRRRRRIRAAAAGALDAAPPVSPDAAEALVPDGTDDRPERLGTSRPPLRH
jgi:hypothetical protein